MANMVYYPPGTFFPVMTKEEWIKRGKPHIIYQDKDAGRFIFTTIEECFTEEDACHE